ncbi:Krueppel homolog 1-like [Anopheles maculipalpis]|uniref:Krueppel homolog 1-like n=1 Tax=Anopheles maculipalpis TaxID=1496333 RepID=UPI002159B4C1|nr:Krueppel homolog 1-like [Anopheles maculipalpis]
MKKGVETATTTTKAVVAAAAAAAAAATLAKESVDLWTQQDWIKTILSKSGTEIKEVPAEDLCKMVYYSGLPLLMTQQQQQQQQQHGSDGTILQLNYSDATSAEQYAISGHPSRNGGPNAYQPQQQHHTISLTNGLTISNGPQSCSSTSSSTSSNSSSNGQLTIVLNPPVTVQGQPSSNLTTSTLAGAYGGPISPLGERGPSSSPEQSAYSGPLSSSPTVSSKFRCEQCNISFGSKSAHTSHMKSHAKQQQLAGEKITGAKLAESGSAGSGTGAGTAGTQQPDPYQCDVCKKTFAVPARLVRHYRTHTGERPFECEFCHKMFSVKENLQVHRRIHTKERPYKCEICGRAFEHSGKLHRHMRIHTGERPHKCNVCGKTFIQSGQLVIHMRTHTGEKPYKCPVEGCGKGFTCSKQLKVHSRTHTGEKPYHCDICFRDFGYNHVLKLHRVQHYGAKCYKCTICDETFKSKKEMEAHIKGHANELPDDEEGAPEGAGDCKLEDVSASAPSSTALESTGGNSNSSSSNSSFEYSSRMSYTEGTEHTPSSDERSGQASSSEVGRFTILKSSSPSPRSSSVGVNDEPPASVEEDDEEEDEEGEDEEEEDNDRKQIPRYDGMGQSFDESLQRAYGGIPTGGVAPALLAAASIAAAVENGCTEVKFCPEMKPRSISPVQQSAALSLTRITPPPSSGSSSSSSSSSSSVLSIPAAVSVSSTHLELTPGLTAEMASSAGQYMYEPLAIMKHHGYFAPASQITEYRSSSDIVRQVEAAIAGTENLLTPPRSSPESPDRSSSPESDSVLMADRDNNTLPPRKRKLYFKDSQQQPQSVSAPKMAVLDSVTATQQYSVPMGGQQQHQSLDTNAGHQQLFHHHHQVPAQRHTTEENHQTAAYYHLHHDHHQPRPDEQRSVKLEVLQNVSPSHHHHREEQRRQQQSPIPTQPQASVIRMSSVIQYANKSS